MNLYNKCGVSILLALAALLIIIPSSSISADDEYEFAPAESIWIVSNCMVAGTTLLLEGSVGPIYATNTDITWTIGDAGGTGATIKGNVLSATSPGAVIVTATIENGAAPGIAYSEDVTIIVTREFVPVTNITGAFTGGRIIAFAGSTQPLSVLQIYVIVSPSTATNKVITWTLKDAGKTGASIEDNKLYFPNKGKAVVTATIEDGKAAGMPFVKDVTIDVLPSSEEMDRNFLIQTLLSVILLIGICVIIRGYVKGKKQQS